MPFDLKNAPGSFQRLMTQDVLAGLLHKFALMYLDDIIVFSPDWNTHLQQLALTFESSSTNNTALSPSADSVYKS